MNLVVPLSPAGGLAQLLAGMWEARRGKIFGATAFSSYGAFWISFGLFGILSTVSSFPLQAAGCSQLCMSTGVVVNSLQRHCTCRCMHKNPHVPI